MSDKPKLPQLNTSEGGSFLTIPCDTQKFAQFISGLLGRPQEIARQFIGTFCLTISEIENFYHLIEQRVHEQQKADLVQFQAIINYTDGSSVKLGSLEALKEYSEVRPLICRGVSLSWVYLVKFPNKDNQERQAIDIDMRVGNKSRFTVIEHNSDLFGSEFPGMRGSQTGVIVVRINHTARSWGTDIENLLSGHIENFISNPDGKIRLFARRYSGKLAILAFIISVSFFAGLGLRVFNYWSGIVNEKYAASTMMKGEGALAAKIDFIASTIGAGQNSIVSIISLVYVIVVLSICIPIGIWMDDKASCQRPSFILLSRASESRMKEVMEGYDRSWSTLIFMFLVNAIAGVVGNIIFTTMY